MADVRALLKAKRQQDQPRIQHPYASYSSSTNQLRCIICDTTIKNASWEGHLGSKAHRVNVAKVRAEQERQLAQEKADEQDDDNDEEEELTRKRKVSVEEQEERETKRVKADGNEGFMNGFFSDPSRSIPVNDDEEDDEEDAVPQPPPQPKSALDDELAQFERLMAIQSSNDNGNDKEGKFQNATVWAEPQLADSTPDGFPVPEAEADVEIPLQEEEEERKKKETDERELIMDRLLDEERAQEDADMKVTIMKAKIEALKKKKREAKKA